MRSSSYPHGARDKNKTNGSGPKRGAADPRDPLQDGTKREPLQITGDAERSLPHARRKTSAATGTESATQVIGEHHCRETPRNALVPPSMAITPTLGFHYMDRTIYEFS